MDRGGWWATVCGVAKESGTTVTKEQQKQGHSKLFQFTYILYVFFQPKEKFH